MSIIPVLPANEFAGRRTGQQIFDCAEFRRAATSCDLLHLAAMSSLKRDSVRRQNPEPKVSFASCSRWGTEPRGWYVDLPGAGEVGANYSPKAQTKLAGSKGG